MPSLASTKLKATLAKATQAAGMAGKRGEKWERSAQLAGARLQLARKERGLSQEDVAELARTDKGTISRVESGALPEMAAGLFLDICEALEQDPSFVWWGKPSGYADVTPEPSSDVRSSQPNIKR